MLAGSAVAAQALSAAEMGKLAGRGAVFLLGVALVVDGMQRRRQRSAAQALAVGPEASVAATSVLPSPRGRRSTSFVVVGGALVALCGVTTARDVIHAADRVQRHVVLPHSVLGLPLNEAMTARASSSLLSRQAAAGEGTRIAAYGTPPHAVLVLATPHGSTSPTRAINDIKAGNESSTGVALGNGTPVNAGRLGGNGHCWNTALRATPVSLCVFVDAGSIVTVYDLDVTNPAATARRALTAREAALHG